MPKAILTTAAVEITCPKCGENIPSPTGSFVWTLDEIYPVLGETLGCECGCSVEITNPKMVRFQ